MYIFTQYLYLVIYIYFNYLPLCNINKYVDIMLNVFMQFLTPIIYSSENNLYKFLIPKQ